eukprot:gene1957-8498_t
MLQWTPALERAGTKCTKLRDTDGAALFGGEPLCFFAGGDNVTEQKKALPQDGVTFRSCNVTIDTSRDIPDGAGNWTAGPQKVCELLHGALTSYGGVDVSGQLTVGSGPYPPPGLPTTRDWNGDVINAHGNLSGRGGLFG